MGKSASNNNSDSRTAISSSSTLQNRTQYFPPPLTESSYTPAFLSPIPIETQNNVESRNQSIINNDYPQYSIVPESPSFGLESIPIVDVNNAHEYMSLPSEFKYKCNMCTFECYSEDEIKNHVVYHQNPGTDVEVEGEEGKKFTCDQCDYRGTSQKVLNLHKRKHLSDKPFKCEHCDYAATQRGHLTAHQRSHSGEKPFKCDQCSFTAAWGSTLLKHKRTHTGEKPFKCNQCAYATNDSGHLERHKLNHNTEKPFRCENCKFRCKQKAQLISHHKRMHERVPLPLLEHTMPTIAIVDGSAVIQNAIVYETHL